MEVQKEIWKQVVGYEGYYEVSSYGRVLSVYRVINGKHIGGILKPHTTNRGYYNVSFCKNGVCKNVQVHQIIAIAFLGHKQGGIHGIVVDHIDGNKKNNNVSNLQLITSRDNVSKGTKNKTGECIGSSWCARSRKWKAMVQHNRKKYIVGYFNTDTEASAAYAIALNNIKYDIMPDFFGKKQRRLRKL